MVPSPRLAALSLPLLRSQPDERLVGLLRAGRGEAASEVVRRYRGALVAFATGFVGADRAEDVVHDALTRALVVLRDSGHEVELRPWLYAIVRNLALNELRDRRPHAELGDELDGVPQPPRIAEQRQRLAEVVEHLKRLPDAQREALVRRELAGAGHSEIAVALGTSPSAVRQLIFRARRALREGAGALVPLPLVRAILDLGPGRSSELAGVGASAATVGAAGITGGGGTSLAVKAGATLAVAAIAAGSGLAIKRERDGGSGDSGPHNERSAPARAGTPDGLLVAARAGTAGQSGRQAAGEGSRGGGDSGNPIRSGSGNAGDSSGSGGSGGDGRGHSGSGSGESGHKSSSGDDEYDEPEEPEEPEYEHEHEYEDESRDNSGSGSYSSGSGSDDETEYEGSHSGSSSSGSGSSSSGSGSGDESD